MPTTEWDLVKDYSYLPHADFSDGKEQLASADSTSPHLDIDLLVIFILEGADLTPEVHAHLLKCMRCRDSMVVSVSDELRRWHNTRLCETRDNLFYEWRDATEMYAASLSELTGKAGRVPDSELLRLAKITEVTRKLTAQGRAEYDEHIAKHFC